MECYWKKREAVNQETNMCAELRMKITDFNQDIVGYSGNDFGGDEV